MKAWKNISGTARKLLGQQVTAGVAVCSRCGKPVTVRQEWDVDHIQGQDTHPHLIDAPSNWSIAHRKCNRRAGAQYGNRKRGMTPWKQPPPPSRPW